MNYVQVVIIPDLGQRQKSAENTIDLPKIYRGLLYVIFHNLESQNAGLFDVKKDLN